MNNELILYILKSGAEGSGDYEPLALFSLSWFILLGVAILFSVLTGYLIWLYYQLKDGQDAYEARYQHRSSGSFVGFWARNRLAIIGFMAAVFGLIALCMLFFVCFGWLPLTSWV